MRGVRLLRQLGHRDAFLPTCGAIFRRPSQYGYHSWLCEGSRMTSTREEQPRRHAATLSGVDTSVFACQAGIVGVVEEAGGGSIKDRAGARQGPEKDQTGGYAVMDRAHLQAATDRG